MRGIGAWLRIVLSLQVLELSKNITVGIIPVMKSIIACDRCTGLIDDAGTRNTPTSYTKQQRTLSDATGRPRRFRNSRRSFSVNVNRHLCGFWRTEFPACGTPVLTLRFPALFFSPLVSCVSSDLRSCTTITIISAVACLFC